MEILGAREQAATARALRTAYKPTQGQMVGGWYVKPTWSQNLADAMMQYNNYKNEQASTAKAQGLIDARQVLSKNADDYRKNAKPEQPGYQIATPAIESGTTNADLDKLIGAMPQDAQGQPIFSDSGPITDTAPTPSATPPSMPNDGAQAYVAPTATATGNINANPTSNRYTTHLPTDAQELTASDNVPAAILGNAVRNAPLDNSAPGAALAADINSPTPIQTGGTSSAPAEQTLPTTAPREVAQPAQPAEPSMIAKILRGEGEYAPVRKAGVIDVPPVPSNFDRMTYVRLLGLANRNQEADREVKNMDAQLVADTARATAQMADLKVQREGILNREQVRAIATERIEDNAKREKQRAEDKKEFADSLRAFTASEHALNRTLTREESSNRRADRQATRDQAQLGRLGKDERYVQDDKGQPTGKTELIPGTTTWMKAKSDSSGEFQSLTAVNRGADKLRKDIKAILSDSGFEKSFGQIAGRTPDSAADVQRVANLFRNIEGQLQARGLGINKQENGSIGAMAVAEWEKMAALLAVVKRTDSPEAARAAYLGALDILNGVTSAASQKYQNEWGGGQFDLSSKKSGSAPSGGVKKYNPDTGKIE
jgi:hypothetical protein